MQVNCSNCDHSIKIPDEKVPKNKVFNVTCPSCKTKNKIDQHLNHATPSASEGTQESVDTSSMVESFDFDEEEETVFYGENDKVALVLDDKNKDTWVKTLEDMGYKLQFAKSPEHATHKLKFTQFHLIALHENFCNVPLDKNEAYQFIIEMPMSTRRKMFVALAGAQLKTMHNMEAFAASVNMVINENDLKELGKFLKAAINENETFYKVFKETLIQLGKV